MTDGVRFEPAATLSLEAFAELFTRSFENYFYPGVTTAATLAARSRFEQIDLSRSLALYAGAEPAGQAVLALRGERAWCGGFGVAAPFRGRGLAHALLAALIEQARAAGARELSLEVLTRNQAALTVYLRGGLAIGRDLLILEWRPAEPPQGAGDLAGGAAAAIRALPARELLRHFDRLHAAPAAWQRDLPALLVRPGLQGMALAPGGEIDAYLLFSEREGAIRIEDLAAREADQAAALLTALQARAARISTVNEPSDSPSLPAFAACGFQETDRQHEMALTL